MKTPAKKYRLEVDLTEAQFNRLGELATQFGVEKARIFKDAIKLLDFMASKAPKGSSFVEVAAACEREVLLSTTD